MSHQYVDRERISLEMHKYHDDVMQAKKEGKPTPMFNSYIAKSVLDIATHLAMRPNFNQYTYKEEMIGDAIENCVKYLHNYDPKITNYAFAYITQVCWYAFIRRIKMENKEQKKKVAIVRNMDMNEFLSVAEQDTDEDFRNQFVEFLRENSIDEDCGETASKKPQEKELTHAELDNIFEE